MIEKHFEQAISAFEKKKNEYTIWIIANVADTVQDSESFIRHSDFSEFFSKAEFSSIASAITEIFGYVRIFYSELEFIKFVLANRGEIDIIHTIIYNFTRDGLAEGKKSLIPAFCDLFGLNYIGSNPFVVSLLRNKFVFSKFLESMKIPIPKTNIYNSNFPLDFSGFEEGETLLAKNVYESASIGMSIENIICDWDSKNICTKLNAICEKLNTNQLLVQNYIEGIECETFVINMQGVYYAFPPIALFIHGANILTSQISDLNEYSFFALSKQCDNQICNRITDITAKAAQLLNIKNYARFDYRVKSNGDFYLIDIAGSPYLTRHSSIAYLFTEILGLEYNKIFSLLATLANMNQSQDVNCKSESKSPLEK